MLSLTLTKAKIVTAIDVVYTAKYKSRKLLRFWKLKLEEELSDIQNLHTFCAVSTNIHARKLPWNELEEEKEESNTNQNLTVAFKSVCKLALF